MPSRTDTMGQIGDSEQEQEREVEDLKHKRIEWSFDVPARAALNCLPMPARTSFIQIHPCKRFMSRDTSPPAPTQKFPAECADNLQLLWKCLIAPREGYLCGEDEQIENAIKL